MSKHAIPMVFVHRNARLPLALNQTVPIINSATRTEYVLPNAHHWVVRKEIVQMISYVKPTVYAMMVNLCLRCHCYKFKTIFVYFTHVCHLRVQMLFITLFLFITSAASIPTQLPPWTKTTSNIENAVISSETTSKFRSDFLLVLLSIRIKSVCQTLN